MIVKKITASNDDIDVSDFSSLKKAVLNGGSANSTAIIFDGRTQSGGIDVLKLSAIIADTADVDFEDGELPLKNGCSVTLAGTGAVLYLYFA